MVLVSWGCFAVGRIVHPEVGEGNVGDGNIVIVVGERGVFKRGCQNVGRWIEQLRNPDRDQVLADAGALGWQQVLRHQPEEVTDAYGGLQDAQVRRVNAQPCHRLPNAFDYRN